MGEQIRFTPQEIQELVESGALRDTDLHLMDPADAKVALAAMLKANQGEVLGAPMMPPRLGKLPGTLFGPRGTNKPPSNLTQRTATEAVESGTDFAGHVGRSRGVQLRGEGAGAPLNRSSVQRRTLAPGPKADGSRTQAIMDASPGSKILEEVQRVSGGSGARSSYHRGRGEAPARPKNVQRRKPSTEIKAKDDTGTAARRTVRFGGLRPEFSGMSGPRTPMTQEQIRELVLRVRQGKG